MKFLPFLCFNEKSGRLYFYHHLPVLRTACERDWENAG